MENFKCSLPKCLSQVAYICSDLSTNIFFCKKHIKTHLEDCSNQHENLIEVIEILLELRQAKFKLEKKTIHLKSFNSEFDELVCKEIEEMGKELACFNKLFIDVLQAVIKKCPNLSTRDVICQIDKIKEKCRLFCWFKSLYKIQSEFNKKIESIYYDRFFEYKKKDILQLKEGYQQKLNSILAQVWSSSLGNSDWEFIPIYECFIENWNKIHKIIMDCLETLVVENQWLNLLDNYIKKLKAPKNYKRFSKSNEILEKNIFIPILKLPNGKLLVSRSNAINIKDLKTQKNEKVSNKSPNDRIEFLLHENAIYLFNSFDENQIFYDYPSGLLSMEKFNLSTKKLTVFKSLEIEIEQGSIVQVKTNILFLRKATRAILIFDLLIDSFSHFFYARGENYEPKILLPYESRLYVLESGGKIFECDADDKCKWNEIGTVNLTWGNLRYKVFKDGTFYLNIKEKGYKEIYAWFKFELKKKKMSRLGKIKNY